MIEYVVAILAVTQAYTLFEGWKLRKYVYQLNESYSCSLQSQGHMLQDAKQVVERLDRLEQ